METLDDSSAVVNFNDYQNTIHYLTATTLNFMTSGTTIEEPIIIKKNEVELLGNKLKELGK